MSQCIGEYIRLSSEDDNVDGKRKAESNSVTSQRKLISGYIAGRAEFSGVPVAEYVDDGYSGADFCRPGFMRMMEDARAGRISVIIVKDFSRFGRDHLEVGNYLEKILPLLGIRFIAINEGFDSDNCSGVTVGMSTALKNMLNAMYCRDLSKKVHTALDTHIKNGKYMASHPKYGYLKSPEDKHHLVVDPEAAEVVRLIFTMASEGKTKNQIVRHLNENHIPTCLEHMREKGINLAVSTQREKKLWSVTSVANILQSEVYLGKTVWNKKKNVHGLEVKQINNDPEDWIVVEGTHEPIITQELFDKANDMAFTHVKRPHEGRSKKTAFLLCPSCGRRMMLARGNKMYRCAQASTTGLPDCSKSKIDREELQQTVLVCARNMVRFISGNLEQQKKDWLKKSVDAENITTLEGERKRLASRKMKLYSDYRAGILTKEHYLSEFEATAKRISEIDQKIEEMENDAREIRAAMEQAADKQADLDDVAALIEYDEAVLSKIIQKIYVYGGDKVEIVWKLDDIFSGQDRSEIVVPMKKEY